MKPPEYTPIIGLVQTYFGHRHFSYDKFQQLMSTEKEEELLEFLVQANLVSKESQCLLCGGMMRREKDGKQFFWIRT